MGRFISKYVANFSRELACFEPSGDILKGLNLNCFLLNAIRIYRHFMYEA